MPKKRVAEIVACKHFSWRIKRRGDVFVADGRSNTNPLGRFSLGTSDRKAALEELAKLDILCAVKQGKAEMKELTTSPMTLALGDGCRQYQQYIARPAVVRGARAATIKRYRAVFDKFSAFATLEKITTWNQVNRRVLEAYAAYLDDNDYAYATEYLELNTIKSAMKWFVNSELLPAECLFTLKMSKPSGTTTYCWTSAEVASMVVHCQKTPDLEWLRVVIIGLACTGLRISELAALRWSDVDIPGTQIRVGDETGFSRKQSKDSVRQTKTGKSRCFPIANELLLILKELPRHPDGRIFHGPRGGMLKPDTVRRILIRDVLEPLADRFPTPPGQPVGFVDGRLHSFRHYFCSVCARSVSEVVAMSWLGHSSSKMLRHYFHLHNHESQQQMQKLDFLACSGAKAVPDQKVKLSGGA